jgi:pantoate--beta-alanine ligase
VFIFNSTEATFNNLGCELQSGKSIGFVPTMGALHEGHIELVRRARGENHVVVCSIFVNPIQFNNPEDFAKYPITIEDDLQKLFDAGCDVVFNPSAKEMYPKPDNSVFDFGQLENVMEGAFRPGHFNGVAIVVKKLLEIVRPNKAYFGEKDYQQLLIVTELVRQLGMPVEIVPCAIVREADGLAMSSRNMRLSAQERAIAPVIYKTLCLASQMASQKSIADICLWVKQQIEANQMTLEYFEIADAITLQPANQMEKEKKYRAFIAAFLGPVRLIDNIPFA